MIATAFLRSRCAVVRVLFVLPSAVGLVACEHAPSSSSEPPPATGGNASTGGRAATGSGGSGSGGNQTGGRAGNAGTSIGGAGNGLAGRGGTGTVASCATGTPSPAANGAAFPFPQHRAKSSCVYPSSCQDAVVAAAWPAYRKQFIVDGGNGSLRVRRTENGDDTVSEGMGYGLIFAAVMNDRDTFDKLWKYVLAHLDSHGLMHWRYGADGGLTGNNSATDADEDIGFGLLLADKQWGGYASTAKDFLGKVAGADFTSDGTIRGGDEYNNVNASYLAPAFYRAFAAYTGDKRWTTILEKSYQTLASMTDGTTGLVPDWQGGDGYGYDAARTPYRIALDACWNGEPRAKEFSTKLGAFFAKMGAAGIRDGYKTNGTVTGQWNNATFIGPAGAAGMAGDQQAFVSDVYAALADTAAEASDNYYNTSWAFFTVLLMTGNFIDFSNP